MAFRKRTLSDLRRTYDDMQFYGYGDSSTERHTLRLLNNPLWHVLEEALKENPVVETTG